MAEQENRTEIEHDENLTFAQAREKDPEWGLPPKVDRANWPTAEKIAAIFLQGPSPFEEWRKLRSENPFASEKSLKRKHKAA